MDYEHLVQINDLTQPQLPRLDRAQLWSGLLTRAERPELFDAGIDATRVLERGDSWLLRAVRRGASTAVERVRWVTGVSIELTPEAGTDFAGSRLLVRIEEPVPAALFLRFCYALRGPQVPVDDAEQRAIRSAYYQSDVATVRQIRALAARPA